MNKMTGSNPIHHQLVWRLALWLAATRCWAATADAVQHRDQPELILSASQSWGELGLNTAVHEHGKAGLPLRIGGKCYTKGIGHHANGTITVLLEGCYTSFDAEAASSLGRRAAASSSACWWTANAGSTAAC